MDTHIAIRELSALGRKRTFADVRYRPEADGCCYSSGGLA